MMHPETCLKWVSDDVGYGVFATRDIPKGTAVYVRDALEIKVERNATILKNPIYSELIHKYSYVDGKGDYILSWDHARFVNHCCHANTQTTGYGFEIAVRDIKAGEEITDDYGLLNIEQDIPLTCSKGACRGVARANDFDRHVERWDAVAQESLSHFYLVDQPLLKYLDPATLQLLNQYVEKGVNYQSVRTQRFNASEDKKDLFFLRERKLGMERSE